ncbi:hypothetical protein F0L17_11490 [Streptomyces sp. TRM43335]|uniref:Uncharacterized protein n=1 Tax=Streptomyces taklimakanensis TaxID=2569853 RepID=A0A6G2BC79_9ACTN|nr:hypothetical protein [Streptomyces taklimakanensis]MTE19736.1 hypothetical protein [Streptomyces taklimakanensis]
MESRTRHSSTTFADSEDFARAARAVGADTTAEALLGLDDRGFWWTLTPVDTAPAPDFVPIAPLAELPEEAVTSLRRWVVR